jgi:alpha-glucosidase
MYNEKCFSGVTARLQHLKDSGIGATWLSPFYKSPNFDSGYDIQDFFDVDPLYGTMADFEALIVEANRLEIKIIMDFVPNHSSHLCEWFQKSLNKSSEYADWYIWADPRLDDMGNKIPPNNWVFSCFIREFRSIDLYDKISGERFSQIRLGI